MHPLPVTSSKEVVDAWKSQGRWLLLLHHRRGPRGGRGHLCYALAESGCNSVPVLKIRVSLNSEVTD